MAEMKNNGFILHKPDEKQQSIPQFDSLKNVFLYKCICWNGLSFNSYACFIREDILEYRRFAQQADIVHLYNSVSRWKIFLTPDNKVETMYC